NIFDIAELKKRLGGKDVFLLEDAAQSLGGILSGRKTGDMGDASIVSFGAGKTIDCGGGGAVLTDSDEFYERCLEVLSTLSDDPSARTTLRNEFMKEMFALNKSSGDRASFIDGKDELKRKYKDAYVFGVTEKMVDDIASAFDGIDNILAGTKTKAALIAELLSSNTKATLPVTLGEPVYWRYSFLVNGDRDAVFNKLSERKISASRFFSPLHVEYDLPDEDYSDSIRLFDKVINVRLDFAASLAQEVAETLDNTIDKYAG
ncbi:MAG: DegT/DnrJ/EryC1/StrS family aminotransferase, partial [Thermodesulfobacteriota bacterium]